MEQSVPNIYVEELENWLRSLNDTFWKTDIEVLRRKRDTILSFLREVNDDSDPYRCPLCGNNECSH